METSDNCWSLRDMDSASEEEVLYREGGETLEGVTQRIVDVSSLEVFKDRLSEAFRNLVFWNVLCLWQPGWKWTTLKVPSKPNHFIIL